MFNEVRGWRTGSEMSSHCWRKRVEKSISRFRKNLVGVKACIGCWATEDLLVIAKNNIGVPAVKQSASIQPTKIFSMEERTSFYFRYPCSLGIFAPSVCQISHFWMQRWCLGRYRSRRFGWPWYHWGLTWQQTSLTQSSPVRDLSAAWWRIEKARRPDAPAVQWRTNTITGRRPGGSPAGMQLSVVTEKLTVVTDGAPEKGRRYHTFSHTERASLAIIYLCIEYAVHIPSICTYITIKYL